MNETDILKDIELFVLDMDGTFYLGNNIIDGALDFLEAVKNAGKRYMFFTNNSSTNSDKYIEKLAGMNCFIKKDQIMTSGDVMIRFLKSNYYGKSIYLLGTKPLEESFLEAGIELFNRDNEDALEPDNLDKRPDIVVVGFDKTLDFRKLSNACTYIREGALFLATHLDINCPMPNGFIPDCGAICKAIELSTGCEPRFVGKPFKETVDMIVDATGVSREKIAFVGDRLYTDVATGVKNGAKGILVLTGECQLSDVDNSDVKPDAIFESIYEMGKKL
ncbi:phosphoglycolate/pyridoxal phosphate phosphatase family/Haloacid Dehalogenase Superfamily Class (subfamily) IIA [Butyrivibrio sp. Su6]|uniref:HAD-IIA family hydrolase n=1 Tax=Butyrivibrio sp. Su6 TaxID=1520810 RepID=UPI00089E3311|nr:HAD-IIA family hydrolase [Butyrivibrio sp. Su6]SEG26489.1 phosphoglycolate/pyridoxal phosphate phosphatase family/Haloacid Dehalogenase Superfamily Class (subfamily) IIA [Butyrivibrio sp. Su6]